MKRLLSIVLCVALLVTCSQAAGWSEWAEGALEWGQDASISEKLLENPDATVTRAVAAQLLYEAAGSPEVEWECPFTDLSEEYADAVSWAAGLGYVMGVGEGLYSPDRPVTRQEFASILYRKAGVTQPPSQVLGQFDDMGDVAEWAHDAMSWCVEHEIMNGRSTSLLAPAGTITIEEALLTIQRAAQLPDLTGMTADLEILTRTPRSIGSQGEADAVQYISERFRSFGFDVTVQPYTNAQGQTGSNVIAVRAANDPSADILVLSAHHDSDPSSPGATDNASGVAALLMVAEALAELPTDTELRFISFTDEENGKNGSRAYTDSLSEQEQERMIGDIQFDMLGGLGTTGTVVSTADGEPNWLSDLLMSYDPSLSLGAEAASDHTSFQLAGIPSVLIMQNGRGYLYHSAADTTDNLDMYEIASAVDIVLSAVCEVISADTPSYRELAHTQGDEYTFCQTRQSVIYFSSSLAGTEAALGASGELVESFDVNGNGWTDTYDTYLYSMRWFGGDTPFNTYYQYRNGFLSNITLRPEETGYNSADVRGLLTAMYGEPIADHEDGADWADEIYGKYISLKDGDDGCEVTVSGYSLGLTNTLASYTVENGFAEIDDTQDAAVWDYLCSILPLEARQKIVEFNLFTDGAGSVLAYTSSLQNDGKVDNTRFSISIDYYDVYDENGARRDWSKLTYTIIHEYGHVLLEDETQIDISVSNSTHDPAAFIDGSLRHEFYDRFWSELGDSAVSDYTENPTNYASRYGANYFHEDIADTFALFVLGSEPHGDTVAEEKLRFFWLYDDMLELRSTIRQNLGLEPRTQTDSSSDPDTEPEPSILAPSTTGELQEIFESAITRVAQPGDIDVSALEAEYGWEIAARNLYFDILSKHPDYKYAYDMTAEETDGVLRCTFFYMPYRTGKYPDGFEGADVRSLGELISTAKSDLSQENIPVRITDPSLTVDDMNRALQQVGGSYLLCELNRDGTAITVTPLDGMTHDEALARLSEIDELAAQVVLDCVTPGMTDAERASALYSYLTSHVTYDFRYYSQPAEMPYASMTAYGALHDGTAICGGFAQALQVLFENAGIPCLTVSGSMGGENHMWNLAYIDGHWLYFDATSDRGRADYGFYYCGVTAAKLVRYEWDAIFVSLLSKSFAF